MTDQETYGKIRWNNFKREVAKCLYPSVFVDKDDLSKQVNSDKIVKDKYKKQISELEQSVEDLNSEIIDIKLDNNKIDLDKFSTGRQRKINGRYMHISEWLSNRAELEIVKEWVTKDFKYVYSYKMSDDQLALQIRKDFHIYLGSKDRHTPDNEDTWQKPSQFINNKFKGDCDDHATFLHYVFQAISELHNRPNLKDNLYMILGGVNMKDGWNWGNHASLVWKHSDNKFYVVESAVSSNSDYIQDSINKFGVIDYTKNIRYGRIVFMSNKDNNYYQVRL